MNNLNVNDKIAIQDALETRIKESHEIAKQLKDVNPTLARTFLEIAERAEAVYQKLEKIGFL